MSSVNFHFDLSNWEEPKLFDFSKMEVETVLETHHTPVVVEGKHSLKEIEEADLLFRTMITPPNSPTSQLLGGLDGQNFFDLSSGSVFSAGYMDSVFDNLVVNDTGIFSPPLSPDFFKKMSLGRDGVVGGETIDPRLLNHATVSDDEIVDVVTVDDEATAGIGLLLTQGLPKKSTVKYSKNYGSSSSSTKKTNKAYNKKLSKTNSNAIDKTKKSYTSKKVGKATSAIKALKNADLTAQSYLQGTTLKQNNNISNTLSSMTTNKNSPLTSNAAAGENDEYFTSVSAHVGSDTHTKPEVERKRQMHNILERKRREDLKSTFNDLGKVIPELAKENGKASISQVLTYAIDTIKKCQNSLMEVTKKKKLYYQENYELQVKLKTIMLNRGNNSNSSSSSSSNSNSSSSSSSISSSSGSGSGRCNSISSSSGGSVDKSLDNGIIPFQPISITTSQQQESKKVQNDLLVLLKKMNNNCPLTVSVN